MLLFTGCLLLLPLWESVVVLCFVVRYRQRILPNGLFALMLHVSVNKFSVKKTVVLSSLVESIIHAFS